MATAIPITSNSELIGDRCILAGASAVKVTAHDGFVNIDIPVPDLQVKAAVGVSTDPGFIVNRCPLTTKVRQGY